MSRPAKRFDSLVDEATARIRDRILDLSLPPGRPINSKELVETLKLSRTPIREALNRLAAEGLIRFEANQGVFVHPLDVDEINQLAEANLVAERVSAYYCDLEEAGLVDDVVRMQTTQRAALKDHHYLDASYWNAQFRTRIARSSGNHHLVEFHQRTLNHTRRLSILVYAMEARDLAYYDSQIEMLRGMHAETEDALRRHDRALLLKAATHQAGVFRARVALAISRRSAPAAALELEMPARPVRGAVS